MEKQLSKNDQIKAAYALNLCTVSVSQIIDYDDINILEQEYDAILNNLNLEHMPHDEALLNILKQLMDTITYFRMSEIDKQILEMEYAHKMKNAIWSAVPNLSMLIVTGNPFAIPISLAAQIGTGYMNYRRAKAENQLESAKKYLQLQRTAMEQFNGLRRELFDTAWRLADAYHFSDELRLTERQIKQYDTILMDADLLRRYDRLDAIKANFQAYPPFWYYFANTANAIARSGEIALSDESRAEYRQLAKTYYQEYWQANCYPLLREDQMASACALEYADLLIEDGAEKNEIADFVQKAESMSGRACDILQLCAMAYLRINKAQEATNLLRYLVNEEYNTSVNAQLLSALYVQDYQSNRNPNAKTGYETLANRVDPGYLIPWPTDGRDLMPVFVDRQRNMLMRKFRQVLSSFKEKYSIRFNKILPPPSANKEYPDSYFSEINKQNRLEEIRSVFSVKEKRDDYLYRLAHTPFALDFIDTFNEMFIALSGLKTIRDLSVLTDEASALIHAQSETISSIQEKIQDGSFTVKDYIQLQNYASSTFSKPVYDSLEAQLEEAVRLMREMNEFSAAENDLLQFCRSQELPEPEAQIDKTENGYQLESQTKLYFSYELLDKSSKMVQHWNKRTSMLELIKEKKDSIVTDAAFIRFLFPEDEDFNRYFSGKKTALSNYKQETLAILDDRNLFSNYDLVLTENGILCIIKDTLQEICTYEAVKYNASEKEICIGSKVYGNKHMDANALFQLLQGMNRIIVED